MCDVLTVLYVQVRAVFPFSRDRAPDTLEIDDRACPVAAVTLTEPSFRWVTLYPKDSRSASAPWDRVFSVTDLAFGVRFTAALNASSPARASAVSILKRAVLSGVFRICAARAAACVLVRPMASAAAISFDRPRV